MVLILLFWVIVLSCGQRIQSISLDLCRAYPSGFELKPYFTRLHFCGDPVEYIHNFNEADVNRDGFLDEHEYASKCFESYTKQLFCVYSNSTNSFSKSGFRGGESERLNAMGISALIDKDNDNFVSEKELKSALKKWHFSTRRVTDFFKWMTGNSSDAEQLLELSAVLDFARTIPDDVWFPCVPGKTCSSPLDSKARISADFSSLDPDQDDVVTWDEFAHSAFIQKIRKAQYDSFKQADSPSVSKEDWIARLHPDLGYYWFSFNEFSEFDLDADDRWSRNETRDYLDKYGLEERNLWKLMHGSAGFLNDAEAFGFITSLPSTQFRKFVDSHRRVDRLHVYNPARSKNSSDNYYKKYFERQDIQDYY